MAINYARGFFRLWAILSVLWVLIMGASNWPEAPVLTYGSTLPPGFVLDPAPSEEHQEESLKDLSDKELLSLYKSTKEQEKSAQTIRDKQFQKDILYFIGILASFPVISLLLGLGIRWIGRGFRASQG